MDGAKGRSLQGRRLSRYDQVEVILMSRRTVEIRLYRFRFAFSYKHIIPMCEFIFVGFQGVHP